MLCPLLLAQESGKEGARPRAPAGLGAILGRWLLERPAASRSRPAPRRPLRRGCGRSGARIARRPARRRRRSARLRRASAEHRVRPLAPLNDSKQVSARASVKSSSARSSAAPRRSSCASSPPVRSTATGLHRSNLVGVARGARRLAPPAEACLVDGFRLGPTAPPHRAVVDGDAKSAAIAAASIVAKVVRDRFMRRMDAALSALRLRLARRLHHARALAPSSAARALRDPPPLVPGALLRRDRPGRGSRAASERRALRALPPARLPDPRARTPGRGGYELDLVAASRPRGSCSSR